MGSLPYDHVPLVYGGDKDGIEVDGPDSVVDLFETDVEMMQCLCNEDELVPQSYGARVTRLTTKWPGYSMVGMRPG